MAQAGKKGVVSLLARGGRAGPSCSELLNSRGRVSPLLVAPPQPSGSVNDMLG